MNVEKYLDTFLLESIKSPFDFFFSAIRATNVRPIWLECPVAERKPDNLDPATCDLVYVLLGQPCIHVRLHDFVAFNRAQGFAERVRVHSNTLTVSLVQEAIEERRCNPWLQDQPASDICPFHRLAESQGS